MSEQSDAEHVAQCPKCRSKSFTAYATEECEASAEIKDGKSGEWASSALLNRIACHGQCKCGHKWRFRDKWAIM